MNFKKGVTLVEVLAVVAVISILSTIIVSSLNEARAKARDAVRIESVHTIKEALRAYNVTYGVYPEGGDTTTSIYCDSGDCSGETSQGAGFLDVLIDEGFLSENIRDPFNTDREGIGYYIGYAVNQSEGAFTLGVPLEANSNLQRMVNDGGSCDDMYEVFVINNQNRLHPNEGVVGDPNIDCSGSLGVVESPAPPGGGLPGGGLPGGGGK